MHSDPRILYGSRLRYDLSASPQSPKTLFGVDEQVETLNGVQALAVNRSPPDPPHFCCILE